MTSGPNRTSDPTPGPAVLVTGGAGYIGSHTMVELLGAGLQVVCVDNFCNSTPRALQRVETIAGRPVRLIEGDIRDAATLDRAFSAAPIAAVIHFAALKAVGESVARPLDYYDNNVGGTIALLHGCRRASVRHFVFSSSATVYGVPARLPLTEDMPLSAVNPYGATKIAVEQILRDVCGADPQMSVVSLRYFNPIGAHASGLIGEDPRDIPNNLFPFISQVAIGRRERLSVFGGDWPTPDGTGVRDYIHVVDLAQGHLRALQFCQRQSGFVPINLGTGRGTSVLELVHAFERACARPVPYRVVERRAGDVAACWADAGRARQLLNWTADRTVEQMCADGWRWQQGNPDGYRPTDS
jgi:UDP-glucose 4-epimerase